MPKPKTLSLSKFIFSEAQKLDEERREFFLNWLASHANFEKSNEGKQMEKELNALFYSLSIGKTLEEYKLIIAEIKWCAEVPIQIMRRFASAERQDNRRSLDE